MYDRRASGILLHPTSLPGPGGIGDLGDAAYRFVDWLAAAKQRRWQIMPLGPTSYGDSPYASLSALAGNPLLISLDRLVQDGLLDQTALDSRPDFPADHVDFGPVIDWKMSLQDAIAMGLIYAPGKVATLEKGTELEAMLPALRALGEDVKIAPLGLKANGVEYVRGRWVGAADPRSEGVAMDNKGHVTVIKRRENELSKLVSSVQAKSGFTIDETALGQLLSQVH